MEERDDITLLRIRSPIEKDEEISVDFAKLAHAILFRLMCVSFLFGCMSLTAFVVSGRGVFVALGVVLLAASAVLASLHGPVLSQKRVLYGRMYETP